MSGAAASAGMKSASDADVLVRAEQVIAHYRKMYDRISSLAKIGVWELDLLTESLSWTDEIYDMFDLPRGIEIDRPMTLAMYEPGSRRKMEPLRAKAIREGGSFALDICIRTARGRKKWLRLTADVEQEDGRSVRLFGTKQDITEAVAAQERVQALHAELIHASRQSAMGAMVATLAHDLNQPLTAIANYAAGTRRAIAKGDPGGRMTETGLQAIEENAAALGAMIRQLREITGGSRIGRRRIDPAPMIREAASVAMASAPDGIALRLALSEGVTVDVDPVQIQQVLINLIDNAIEAVRDARRREIDISSAVTGSTLEVSVEDSGAGIGGDMMPHLFESFVTSRPGRLGIGLSIARTIVEAHGGRIEAADRKEGGAFFRISLPLAAEKEDA